MAVVVAKLHGVERGIESKLKTKGVKDSEDLLKRCKTQTDVRAFAEEIEVDFETMNRLVHRAHLARIRGVGVTYTILLEAAGVKTLSDLAVKVPDELHLQLEQINQEQKIVGRVPALAMVNGWVARAQRLPHHS